MIHTVIGHSIQDHLLINVMYFEAFLNTCIEKLVC
jgi:hypothetical protein